MYNLISICIFLQKDHGANKNNDTVFELNKIFNGGIYFEKL